MIIIRRLFHPLINKNERFSENSRTQSFQYKKKSRVVRSPLLFVGKVFNFLPSYPFLQSRAGVVGAPLLWLVDSVAPPFPRTSPSVCSSRDRLGSSSALCFQFAVCFRAPYESHHFSPKIGNRLLASNPRSLRPKITSERDTKINKKTSRSKKE